MPENNVMKNQVKVLVVVVFLIAGNNSYCDTITLNQALLSKKINVTISGADKSLNTTSNTPSYTGLCIQMEIENLTNKDIKVYLDAGRFLEPDDTTIQRMMITKDQIIALHRKVKKKIKSYAMCTQMLNAAPGTATIFKLGELAEGKLLELAKLISKNNYQSNAAQAAVWAMTDNDDVYNIYSTNPAEMKTLRSFVKNAKGIVDIDELKTGNFDLKTESVRTYMNYGKGKLTGSFEFELKGETKLTLALYDMNDKLKITSLSNYAFRDGINTVKYEFTYNNVPLGNYHLKMTDDKGTLLIEKILTFK